MALLLHQQPLGYSAMLRQEVVSAVFVQQSET